MPWTQESAQEPSVRRVYGLGVVDRYHATKIAETKRHEGRIYFDIEADGLYLVSVPGADDTAQGHEFYCEWIHGEPYDLTQDEFDARAHQVWGQVIDSLIAG